MYFRNSKSPHEREMERAERMRARNQERTKRFLHNAKQRIYGRDSNALEAQMKEKADRDREARKLDQAYQSQRSQNARAVAEGEKNRTQERLKEAKQVAAYNEAMALAKKRKKKDDGGGYLLFGDGESKARELQKLQKKQQADWCAEQMRLKDEERKREEQANRAYLKRLNDNNRALDDASRQQESQRARSRAEVLAYNEQMILAKKEKDRRDKLDQQQAKSLSIIGDKNAFRGMKKDDYQKILDEQARQRIELSARRRREKDEERGYADELHRQRRELARQENERLERKRMDAVQLAKDLEAQRLAKNKASSKQDNSIEDAFFDKFGKGAKAYPYGRDANSLEAQVREKKARDKAQKDQDRQYEKALRDNHRRLAENANKLDSVRQKAAKEIAAYNQAQALAKKQNKGSEQASDGPGYLRFGGEDSEAKDRARRQQSQQAKWIEEQRREREEARRREEQENRDYLNCLNQANQAAEKAQRERDAQRAKANADMLAYNDKMTLARKEREKRQIAEQKDAKSLSLIGDNNAFRGMNREDYQKILDEQARQRAELSARRRRERDEERGHANELERQRRELERLENQRREKKRLDAVQLAKDLEAQRLAKNKRNGKQDNSIGDAFFDNFGKGAKPNPYGRDKGALEAQIREKKAREQAERDRDREYEKRLKDNHKNIAQNALQQNKNRQKAAKELAAYNQAQALAKKRGKQAANLDRRAGNGYLRFGGEDECAKDRARRQQNQQAKWIEDQKRQREEARLRENEENRAYLDHLKKANQAADQASRDKALQRAKAKADMLAYNERMMLAKKEREKRQNAEQKDAKSLSIIGDNNAFRGMNQSDYQKILDEQARQRAELSARRRREKEEEKGYANELERQRRELARLENDRLEKKRLDALQLAKDLEAQRLTKKKKNGKQDNSIGEAFFDKFGKAKINPYGRDKKALDDQMKERAARDLADKEREKEYERQNQLLARRVAENQRNNALDRKKAAKELAAYNQAQALAKKKNKVSGGDPGGYLQFGGEDPDAQKRSKLQREQQAQWIRDQQREKEEARRREKEEDAEYLKQARDADKALEEAKRREDALRAKSRASMLSYNERMMLAKKEKDKRDREDQLKGISTMLIGDENAFRGNKREDYQKILDEQARQRAELSARRRREKEEEMGYANEMERQRRELALLENQRLEQNRLDALQLAKDLEAQRLAKNKRNGKQDNSIGDAFFDKFGKGAKPNPYGRDKKALEDQIKDRAARAQADKKRELEYEKLSRDQNKRVAENQRNQALERQKAARELAEYNQAQALARKNARRKGEKEAPGYLNFGGEDPNAQKRSKLQREQQARWIKDQQREKDEARRREEEEDAEYLRRARDADKALEDAKRREDALRAKSRADMLSYNERLMLAKKEKDKRDREESLKAKGNAGLMLDGNAFRGMNREDYQKIQDEQARQRAELSARRRRERAEERGYANELDRQRRELARLENKRLEQKRLEAVQLAKDLEAQRLAKNKRNGKQDNSIGDAFFDRFGKGAKPNSYGGDKKGLDDQIKDRAARARADKEIDEEYEKLSRSHAKRFADNQRKQALDRQQAARELAEYNQAQALKKNTRRNGNDKEAPGYLKFGGEDPDAENRSRLQREQQAKWIKDQQKEKDQARRREKEEDAEYLRRARDADKALEEAKKREDALRAKSRADILSYNERMMLAKKEKDKRDREESLKAKGNAGLMVDGNAFRGMNREDYQKIQDEQARQRAELSARRRRERAEERGYANELDRQRRELARLENKRLEQKRLDAAQLAKDLEAQRLAKNKRNGKQDNSIGDAFFDRFGKGAKPNSYGGDKKGLDDQIKDRAARARADKEIDEEYEKLSRNHAKRFADNQRKQALDRQQAARELAEYNQAQALRKNTRRKGSDKEAPGYLKFGGEDPDAENRSRLQREQQAKWIKDQQKEKDQARRREKEEDAEYLRRARDADKALEEAKKREDSLRAKSRADMLSYNERMILAKKEKDKRDREEMLKAKGNAGLMVDGNAFRGMNREDYQKIRDEQARQRAELSARRRREREEERGYANELDRQRRELARLENQRLEQKRLKAAQLAKDLEAQRLAKKKKGKQDNSIEDAFFEKFGKGAKFNPNGNMKDALDEQIRDKALRDRMDKERDLEYEKLGRDHARHTAANERNQNLDRQKAAREMAAYNQTLARGKLESKRKAAKDSNGGGYLKFLGEDPNARNRTRQQREQQAKWIKDQQREKEMARLKELEGEKAFKMRAAEAEKALEAAEQRDQALRAKTRADMMSYNERMMLAKKEKDKKDREEMLKAKGNGGLLVDGNGFRGMNREDHQKIFDEQARQRADLSARRRREKEEERGYADELERQRRALATLENKKARQKREEALRLAQELEKQKLLHYMKGKSDVDVVWRNKISDEFYEQFQKDCR